MKRNLLPRSLRRGLLAVPAAALMLGAAQAGTTVGLNFQTWYYDSGTTPQTIGFNNGYSAYNTTGFPVTAKAFGVNPADWFSTDPMFGNPNGGGNPINQAGTFGGASTIFAGSLSCNVNSPIGGFQSGSGCKFASGITYPAYAPGVFCPQGEDELLWGIIVGNAANPFSVSVSGLATKFPSGYVIQAVGAYGGNSTVNSLPSVDFSDGITTNTAAYHTWVINNDPSAQWPTATGGISDPSGVFTADTIHFNSGSDATNILAGLAGVIITDQPVVTQSAPASTLTTPGGSFVLTATAIGIGTLSYQWQHAGTNLTGANATFASYTNSLATTADSGDYNVLVTSTSFPSITATGSILVVTVHLAVTKTWDANTGTAGAQDGNGTWRLAGTNWWTGSANEVLYRNDSAIFGAGGTGAYTVTLTDGITANDLTFNSGAYTITNSAGQTLTLSGSPSITANTNGTISVPVTAANVFVKTGPGAATLTAALISTNIFVKAGILEVQAKNGDAPYVVTNGATLKIGYSTGGGYANTALQLYGDGTAATTGLYLKGGSEYNVSGLLSLFAAPTTIRQYGSGMAGLGNFDIHNAGLVCTPAASGSIIDANIQMISRGYGMSVTVDVGANNATGDLVINGPLNIKASSDAPYGLVKYGTGSVRLNATATTDQSGLQILAGTAICGINNCIGTNATLKVAPGAQLDFNGTSQSISNLAQLAGNLKMTINKGGVPSSSVLTVTDGNPLYYDGSLTVTNVGGTLVLGDTFTLFSSSGGIGGGAFTNITLPALSNGLGWTNNLDLNGTIKVITGSVPPSIVTDLSGTTNNVYVGGSASFTVAAAGDATLRYQWKKNGSTPVGSDSPTLTLTSVTAIAGGDYSVTVTNNYGSVTSLTNHLTVITPSGYGALVIVDGPLAYWPLNEISGTTADDVWGTHDATYGGGYSLNQPGPLPGTTGVAFDGSSGSYALAPYAAELNPAIFSVEAWVNPALDNTGTTLTCPLSCGAFGNPRSGWLIYQAAAGWNFRTYHGADQSAAANIVGTTTPASGSWTYLAATWDGTTAQFYVNGVLEGSQVPTTTPTYQPGTSGGFCIGARTDNAFGWSGTASEVAFYNHVLTPAEIQSHATSRPIMTVTRSGADLILAWPTGTGNLQAAPEASGTYTNVPAATSPYTVTPAAVKQFFRTAN